MILGVPIPTRLPHALSAGLLCLSLAACEAPDGERYTSSGPSEVAADTAALLPSVVAKVKAGAWMHGVNLPWDGYRTDFGVVWEDRGLANQGPSGFRRETRGSNGGAKRLFWAKRASGDHCLGVQVALTRPGEAAMVFFQFDDLHDRADGSSVDLAGKTLSAEIYLPASIAGPRSAPTGVTLFLQDDDWTYAESRWRNIDANSTWRTLTVDVSALAASVPGFNPSRVRKVGLKVASNSLSGPFAYWGPMCVDNLNAAGAAEVQFDFKSPDTRSEREFKAIATLPASIVRVWLLADASAVRYDYKELVVGLSEQFDQDMDELIRLARVSGMRLMPVLLDFLLAAEPKVVDGKRIFGRADLINDPAKRRSFIDNAIGPILDKLGRSSEVVVLDLVNEPEWTILARDLPLLESMRPQEIRRGGVIELAAMKAFLREVVALRNSKGLGDRLLLTVGSASPRWVGLWTDVGLDVTQFHLWTGPGQIDEGLSLPRPPVEGPVFIGEVSENVDCDFYERARALGYSGVFPWAYRAKDRASSAGLSAKARDCLRNFADRHPELAKW